MGVEMPQTMPGEALHRKVISAGAVASMLMAGILIVTPMVADIGPSGVHVVEHFLGRSIPERLERVFVLLMGVIWLVEAVLIFDFSPAGWWLAMGLTGLETVNGLLTPRESWLEALVNFVVFLYLYWTRSLFVKTPPASP